MLAIYKRISRMLVLHAGKSATSDKQMNSGRVCHKYTLPVTIYMNSYQTNYIQLNIP